MSTAPFRPRGPAATRSSPVAPHAQWPGGPRPNTVYHNGPHTAAPSRAHDQEKKGDHSDHTNLYLAGVPPQADQLDVAQTCSWYGLVVHTQILATTDPYDRRRASVDYSLPEEAARAKYYLDGTMWGECQLEVTYAKRQLSAMLVRRNQLAAQPMARSLGFSGTNHDGWVGNEPMPVPRQRAGLRGSVPAPPPLPALPPVPNNMGLLPTSLLLNGSHHRTPNMMRTQGLSSSFGSSQSELQRAARDSLDMARRQSYSSGSAVTTPSDELHTNDALQASTTTAPSDETKRIIVLGLPKDMTVRHLRMIGSMYGKVRQAEWIVDQSIGMKYAIFEFDTLSQANRATEELDGRTVGATWPGSTQVEARTYVLVPPQWRSAALDRCRTVVKVSP